MHAYIGGERGGCRGQAAGRPGNVAACTTMRAEELSAEADNDDRGIAAATARDQWLQAEKKAVAARTASEQASSARMLELYQQEMASTEWSRHAALAQAGACIEEETRLRTGLATAL